MAYLLCTIIFYFFWLQYYCCFIYFYNNINRICYFFKNQKIINNKFFDSKYLIIKLFNIVFLTGNCVMLILIKNMSIFERHLKVVSQLNSMDNYSEFILLLIAIPLLLYCTLLMKYSLVVYCKSYRTSVIWSYEVTSITQVLLK